MVLAIIASLFAAAAAFCLSFFVLNAIFNLEIERVESTREMRSRIPIVFRLLMPLLPNARKLAAADIFAVQREKDNDRTIMAGVSDIFSGIDFVGMRLLMFCLGFLWLALFIFYGLPLYGVIGMAVISIFPGVWLRSQVAKRHFAIMRALPNVLDLLTLSVEAGKDFMSSLKDILTRRKLDPLGEELMHTFQEVQLGKKRTQALRDLSNRVRQPDLTSTVNAIIQSEELGVSIGKLLRIQGDTLRNKRFNRAEKLANEAPVKIIFPVILFIFPALIILLAMPILISAMKMLV